ncbi:hypothetical protein GF359_09820, partial [candidate division WOR-3 bacterium]|nr:hypothetical protein [candidate division WOR-3 bacterium]MBD3365497.1 hypothetical protein [candidate division WOR-3 bacterium]
MRNVIPRFIHERYEKGIFEGSFDSATMFVDISGFTSITETLMKKGTEGAERLSSMLNGVFNPTIYEVYRRDGFITGFSGDAFTAVYPGKDPLKPLSSALAIQEKFTRNRPDSKQDNLTVKIGLSYGHVQWGIVTSGQNTAYYFRGEPVSGCAKVIEDAGAGQIVLDDNLYNALPLLSTEPGKIIIEPPESRTETELAILNQSILEKFVPAKILTSKRSGEFREVAPVFISFREIPNFFETPQFVEIVLDKAFEYGGFWSSLNFEDKGPSLLVLFGAPVAYENNIRRAVDFALAVRKEFRFVIRAGITVGTVYAGVVGSPKRSTYTALGDVVNLAARFMMAADWGDIWTSAEVKERLKASYSTEDKGIHEFKGKSHPVQVYRLKDPHMRAAGELFTGRMVGRESELEKAASFTESCLEGRFGGVINVYGEAGIGKSRLLYELAENLEDRFVTSI